MFRKDTQYHRITVQRQRRRAQPALRQPPPARDRPRGRLHVRHPLHRLPPPRDGAEARREARARPRPRRRRAAEADVARLRADAVDSVEIDPVVVDVAKRYFGMPDDPRLRVFTGDARQYVANTKERYDIVVVDAYYSDSLPFHLATTRVLPAGPQRAHPRRRRRVQRHRVRRGRQREAVPQPVQDRRRRVARPSTSSRSASSADGAPDDARATSSCSPPTAAVPNSVLLDRIERRVDGRVSVRGFERYGGRPLRRSGPRRPTSPCSPTATRRWTRSSTWTEPARPARPTTGRIPLPPPRVSPPAWTAEGGGMTGPRDRTGASGRPVTRRERPVRPKPRFGARRSAAVVAGKTAGSATRLLRMGGGTTVPGLVADRVHPGSCASSPRRCPAGSSSSPARTGRPPPRRCWPGCCGAAAPRCSATTQARTCTAASRRRSWTRRTSSAEASAARTGRCWRSTRARCAAWWRTCARASRW